MKKWLAVALLLLGSAAVAEEQAAAPAGAEFAAPNETPTHLVRVLRTTNKAQTNRYVPKVYDLKNVNPYNVLRFFVRVAEIEEGAWFVFGKPEDPADPNSVRSGKAVVIVPIYQIPSIDGLMSTIDRQGLTTGSGDEMLYYRPKHRYVQDPSFVSLLLATVSPNVVPNTPPSNQVADPEVNGFLFYEAPGSIANVRRWLPALDQPPPQVMVEATLYEINVENDDALGLDFVSWKNGPGRSLFAAGLFHEGEKIPVLKGADPLLNTGVPGGTYARPGHKFSTDGRYYSYFLDVPSQFFDFLVTKQKARVLTSCKVLTRNGREAVLEANDSIFYWRTDVVGAGEEADRFVVGDQAGRTLGAKSAGVSLDVTPLIGTEGINLEVELKIVGHTGFNSSGVPQLVRRDFDTEIRVQDAQEVVLGGYTREMFVQQSNKIPILGSLPVIGWLFGGEQNLVKKRQVVVVLSAHVVSDFSAMNEPGTAIDASLIRARARQQVPVKNLDTEAGFDQWLLDKETAQ